MIMGVVECQRYHVSMESLLRSTLSVKNTIHRMYIFYMANVWLPNELRTMTLLEGDLPPKADVMCREWLALYKNELLEMWNTQVFRKLPPLE